MMKADLTIKSLIDFLDSDLGKVVLEAYHGELNEESLGVEVLELVGALRKLERELNSNSLGYIIISNKGLIMTTMYPKKEAERKLELLPSASILAEVRPVKYRDN